MQTNYSYGAPVAAPGMNVDADASSRDLVSRPCKVNIAFGTYCEIDSNGLAIPMQDATTGGSFNPEKLGIAWRDSMAVEQDYVRWTLPTVLAGTVNVTNGSANVTFSQAQTIPTDTAIEFASQPGVLYYLAVSLVAGTAGILTQSYTGASASATTATLPSLGSTVMGYRAGQVASFKRQGRIWVASDASGTPVRTGAIQVIHSSDGSHEQGVFTFRAPQTTVGDEIDVAPGCTVWDPDGRSGTYTDPFGHTVNVIPVEIRI